MSETRKKHSKEFKEKALKLVEKTGNRTKVQRIPMPQILEDRYKIGPLIISFQLEVAGWYEAIGDPTIADGVMDRLTAQAHRVQLKGPSLRKIIPNK